LLLFSFTQQIILYNVILVAKLIKHQSKFLLIPTPDFNMSVCLRYVEQTEHMSKKKVKFSSTSNSAFYATTRFRVSQFFSEQELHQHANSHMWFKTAFFLTGFVGLYLLMIINILQKQLK